MFIGLVHWSHYPEVTANAKGKWAEKTTSTISMKVRQIHDGLQLSCYGYDVAYGHEMCHPSGKLFSLCDISNKMTGALIFCEFSKTEYLKLRYSAGSVRREVSITS